MQRDSASKQRSVRIMVFSISTERHQLSRKQLEMVHDYFRKKGIEKIDIEYRQGVLRGSCHPVKHHYKQGHFDYIIFFSQINFINDLIASGIKVLMFDTKEVPSHGAWDYKVVNPDGNILYFKTKAFVQVLGVDVKTQKIKYPPTGSG